MLFRSARDPLRSEIRVPRGVLPSNIVVAPDGTLSAGDTVLGRMRLVRFAQPTDLEQAMLNVWSLSEGSSPERIAA